MAFEIIRDEHFIVTEMTEAAARVISMWKYEAPYEEYSFKGDEQELEEVLNGLHFPVYFTSQKASKDVMLEDSHIISDPQGFIAWGPAAKLPVKLSHFIYPDKNYIDLALGLSPENCGKGLGEKFVSTAVSFIRNDWEGYKIRLSVAADNSRAIKTYEKCGFIAKKSIKYHNKKIIIMVLS